MSVDHESYPGLLVSPDSFPVRFVAYPVHKQCSRCGCIGIATQRSLPFGDLLLCEKCYQYVVEKLAAKPETQEPIPGGLIGQAGVEPSGTVFNIDTTKPKLPELKLSSIMSDIFTMVLAGIAIFLLCVVLLLVIDCFRR